MWVPFATRDEADGPPDAYVESGIRLGGAYTESIGNDAIERAGGADESVEVDSVNWHEIVRDLCSNCN